MLTKDQILSANDRETAVVDVPEWGGSVRVRVWSGSERDAFEGSLNDPNEKARIRARVAAISVCDDAGERLFGVTDIDKLAAKSAVALDRVVKAAMAINKIDAKAVETATGNS